MAAIWQENLETRPVRSALRDHLQVFPFWVMDLGLIGPDGLPVFTPLAGFSAVSAPEITIEIEDIVEGNAPFRKKAIKRGDVGYITLSRGVTAYESDFWRWTANALSGDVDQVGWSVGGAMSWVAQEAGFATTARRDLLLVHFGARSPFGLEGTIAATSGMGAAIAATAGVRKNSVQAVAMAGLGMGLAALASAADGALRVPAKAHVLSGCIPSRFKSGGDFDAMSGEVSIAEIDLAIEGVEEIALFA